MTREQSLETALIDAKAMLEHYLSGRADNWDGSTRTQAMVTVRQAKAALELPKVESKNLEAALIEARDALRAILFQVVQGKVLERDACITQARAAYAKAITLIKE